MHSNTSKMSMSWFQRNQLTLTWLLTAAMLSGIAATATPALSQEAPTAQDQAVGSAPAGSAPQSPAAPSFDSQIGQADAAPATFSGGTEAQRQISPKEPVAQSQDSLAQPSGQALAGAATPAQGPVSQTAPAQTPAAPVDASNPAGATAPEAVPATPNAVATAAKPDTDPKPGASGPPREHLPHDLSPWNMFLAADIIVKGVMTLLAVASVLAWSIWFGKSVQVSVSARRLRRGMQELDGDASLAIAAERRRSSSSPLAVMIAAAYDEVMRSQGGLMPAAGIKERVASHLSRIEASAGRAMSSGTGLLATIGSTAPFVGLFGTVWGIMNSFIGISQAQTTNLAVVAPGIAEALLATGIGLVAAIPAVIFYNQLARSISGYKASLADCGAMVERLVSRDLDRQSVRTTPYLKAGE
jgi:biopolymer transport protein ExbB